MNKSEYSDNMGLCEEAVDGWEDTTETDVISDDAPLEYYEVTLLITTRCGDPDNWGWEELIGDTVIEVTSRKMNLVEVPKNSTETVETADEVWL